MRYIHDTPIDHRVVGDGRRHAFDDVSEGLEGEIQVSGVAEIGLHLTGCDSMDVIPALSQPDRADVPLDQALVDEEVELVASCNCRGRVDCPREGRGDHFRDRLLAEMSRRGVCLEDTGRIEIETRKMSIYDVVGIANLAVAYQQRGGW